MPKFIDKTGMVFGQLTVLSRAENKGNRIYWNCKCSCGKEVCVRGDKLTPAQVDDKGNPSCGHLRIDHMRKSVVKDFTNQKIGKLTPLEPTEKRSGNGSIIWKCKCDCGNITFVASDCLGRKNNPTKSCGCLQKEKASQFLTKLQQDKLPNIEETINNFTILNMKSKPTNNGRNETWIYSKCPFCDTQKWFQLRYIKNGDTKSCGCITKSAGEKKIEQLLIQNNILFKKEFRFNNCKDKNPLPFDFYINQKYIIEYDGIQHFQPEKFGNITDKEAEQNFKITQKHDKIKNKYCLENNIPLIRIPYTHYNNLCIEDLLLETSTFLVKG